MPKGLEQGPQGRKDKSEESQDDLERKKYSCNTKKKISFMFYDFSRL